MDLRFPIGHAHVPDGTLIAAGRTSLIQQLADLPANFGPRSRRWAAKAWSGLIARAAGPAGKSFTTSPTRT